MIGHLKQFTIREWRGQLRYWVMGWMIGSLICVTLRPFGTDEFMFIGAAAYWFGINGVAAVLMYGILRSFGGINFERFHIFAILGSGVFTVLFSPILFVINQRLFSISLNWEMFGINFVIALLVFAIVWIASPSAPTNQDTSQQSAFEDRLTKFPSAKVLAISALDHYVSVATDQGAELLLMRFSDALSELQSHDGIQVHRSHWVARKAVQNIKGPMITLIDGTQIPISRANAKRAKAFFA